MLKKSALILPALALILLASCGTSTSETSSSSNDPEATSTTVETSTPTTTMTTSEEPEVFISASWPYADVAEFIEGSGVTVPGYASGYTYSYVYLSDDAGPYMELWTVADDISGETNYATTLTNAGWTVDNSDYDNFGYLASDPTNTVMVQFYYDADYGEMLFFIWMNNAYTSVEYWPSSEISAFISPATIGIPIIPEAGPYYYGEFDDLTMGHYFEIYVFISETTPASGYYNIENSYNAALLSGGWTIDESEYETTGFIATSPSGDVTLIYYAIENYFDLYIFLNTAA